MRALGGVDLTVAAGSVHGIVGENGAGKSTLMKSIAGAVSPDEGTVEAFGVDVRGSIRAADDAGIAMIHQELTIIPELSVVDNVFLGSPPRRGPFLDRTTARRRYAAAAELLSTDLHPDDRAGGLSTSARQPLEIMRALVRDKRLVIMDEPTASLGPRDIEQLHRIVRDLRDRGISVLYVSHDLEAVLDVCDTVSVMREGRVVSTRPRAEWSVAALVTEMVGEIDTPEPAAGTGAGPVVLRIDGLRAPGVDLPRLDVRAGEVLGIGGLVGSGRSRLLRALAGADRASAGSLTIDGRAVAWPTTPRAASRLGIVLAPEDRRHQGLVLGQRSAWNVALGSFRRAAVRGISHRTRTDRWARTFTERVGLPDHRLSVPVGTLSGGNQQKVLLARQVSRRPRCLLLDEPTRGIDIGAKAQVLQTLRRLADEGMAVVWVSSSSTRSPSTPIASSSSPTDAPSRSSRRLRLARHPRRLFLRRSPKGTRMSSAPLPTSALATAWPRARSLGVVAALVVLVAVVAIAQPGFLAPGNLMNVLSQWAPVAVMGVGMTYVVITGGFDLSVGATYALCAVVAAALGQTQAPAVAFAVAMLVGLAVGAVNGLIVARPAFDAE